MYLFFKVMAWCLLESREDKAIRRDLIALKKEMNNISMVDEFARYAKLQRKYNKMDDEAKTRSKKWVCHDMQYSIENKEFHNW